MILSEKEQELYDFIVAKNEVTVKMVEEELSSKHVGAIGKLFKNGKIDKTKKRPADGRTMKFVTHYIIKKEEKQIETQEN